MNFSMCLLILQLCFLSICVYVCCSVESPREDHFSVLNRCMKGTLSSQPGDYLFLYMPYCASLHTLQSWKPKHIMITRLNLCVDGIKPKCLEGSLVMSPLLPVSVEQWYLRLKMPNHVVHAYATPPTDTRMIIVDLFVSLNKENIVISRAWKAAEASGLSGSLTIRHANFGHELSAFSLKCLVLFKNYKLNADFFIEQFNIAIVFAAEPTVLQGSLSSIFGKAFVFFDSLEFKKCDCAFFTDDSIKKTAEKFYSASLISVWKAGFNLRSSVAIKQGSNNWFTSLFRTTEPSPNLFCRIHENCLYCLLHVPEANQLLFRDSFKIAPSVNFQFNYGSSLIFAEFKGSIWYGTNEHALKFDFWTETWSPDVNQLPVFYVRLVQTKELVLGLKMILLSSEDAKFTALPANLDSSSFSFVAKFAIDAVPSRFECSVIVFISFSDLSASYCKFQRLIFNQLLKLSNHLNWNIPEAFASLVLANLELSNRQNFFFRQTFSFCGHFDASIYGFVGTYTLLMSSERLWLVLNPPPIILGCFSILSLSNAESGPQIIWKIDGNGLNLVMLGVVACHYFSMKDTSFTFSNGKYFFSGPGKMLTHDVSISGSFDPPVVGVSTISGVFSVRITEYWFLNKIAAFLLKLYKDKVSKLAHRSHVVVSSFTSGLSLEISGDLSDTTSVLNMRLFFLEEYHDYSELNVLDLDLFFEKVKACLRSPFLDYARSPNQAI